MLKGIGNMNKENHEETFFGFSLSNRPKWQLLVLFSSGIFLGYLFDGICEEYIYNRLHFSYGWYFTFLQGLIYLFLIYLRGFRIKEMVNPWKTYVKLSVVLMGSVGLSRASLAYLNYPAVLMFKSTKVLPVMIMGAFMPGLRRRYPPYEYVAAVMLVVGLITFTLADANTSPYFSIIGIFMICCALVMDAFLGNFQEAIFTINRETTQTEMLFCSTVVGLPMLLAPMIFTGELFKAWNSCLQQPHVYGLLLLESMVAFIGQICVLYLVATFGAATTAMITTARKAMTLLLSYLIFTKPLTEQHATGLILIGMGVALKMLPPDSAVPTSLPTKTEARQPERQNMPEDEEENKEEKEKENQKEVKTIELTRS